MHSGIDDLEDAEWQAHVEQFFMEFKYDSMEFQWDLYYKWVFDWNFNGHFMGFLWTFHGIFMECSWGVNEMFMGFSWRFTAIQKTQNCDFP